MKRIITALVATVAAMVYLTGVASAALPANTYSGPFGASYTQLNGTKLNPAHVGVSSSNPAFQGDATNDCTATVMQSLQTGQVLWHFVLTGQSGTPDALSVKFQTAGAEPSPYIALSKVTGSGGGATTHWYVLTPSADTLLAASATKTGGNLNLSHVCVKQAATSQISTAVHLGATDLAVADGGPTPVPATGAALGSIVHDSASLTTTPTPVTMPDGSSVVFTFYSDNTCTTGSALAGETVNVGGMTSPISLDPRAVSPALHAGEYGYKAVFTSGNTNLVLSKTGDCEPFKINTKQLGISTTIHDKDHNAVTAVSLGSVVHDTATLSGVVAGIDPPAVSFTLNGADAGLGTGTGADAIRSADSAPLAAGSYTYAATVASNGDYIGTSSDPEALTVNKATPGFSTDIILNSSGKSVPSSGADLGSIVHDTSSFTGAVDGFNLGPNPDSTGGTVTYTFYTGKSDCSAGADAGFQVTVGSDNAVPPSADTILLPAGDYSYSASYSGNANYNGVNADKCEPLTINKAQLSIATAIHNGSNHTDAVTEVPLGSTVHDSAQVKGAVDGFTPTGAVTFTLNGDLVGQPDDPTPDAYRTVDAGPLHAGSYLYRASVAGDSNYLGARSGPEPLTVLKADTTTATHIYDAAGNDVTTSNVAAGTVVHDSASVTSTNTAFAIGGQVTYSLYPTGDCTGTPTTETVDNGTNSSPFTTTPGAWSYKAEFLGSDDYNGSIGSCEGPLYVHQMGFTKGSWASNPGHTRIVAGGGWGGDNAITMRGTVIDTQTEADAVLGGNACPSVFTNCTTNGFNVNVLNSTASQTLALWYNIQFVSGFKDNTIASLGATVPASLAGQLSGTSTMTDVLNVAVGLINNSVSGGTVTATPLQDMSGLLGGSTGLNREVF